MSISETDSKKPKRGRPRSWRWEIAESCAEAIPEAMQSARSRLNWTLLATACRLLKDSLSDDEQAVIFGRSWAEMLSANAQFPRGWKSAAYELGRLVDEDPEYAVECLRSVVDARRRGISWGGCRAHLRTLRLGRRDGSAVSLMFALSRAVDAYETQYPATTLRQIEAAAEGLLEAVRARAREAAE